MATILELKEKFVRFYGKNETYALPVIRFIIALITFTIINANVGYMKSLSSMPVALILALICAIIPMSGTLIVAGVLLLAHFYALSIFFLLNRYIPNANTEHSINIG